MCFFSSFEIVKRIEKAKIKKKTKKYNFAHIKFCNGNIIQRAHLSHSIANVLSKFLRERARG